MLKCPVCGKDNPLQAIPIEEADDLCLLCEAENICRPCSKIKHPDGWKDGTMYADLEE